MKRNTRSIHCAYPRRDAYDALSMPVYESVAYEFDNAATMADVFCERITAPDYSRVANPTVTHFEDRVAAVTGARRAVAFNSGMAAISSTLLSLTAAGANVVTSCHLFGNTYSLLTETLSRFGVEVRLCDLTRPDALETAIDEHTACLFFEILTNPQLEVADVRALAAVARCHRVPLVADTTMIPFTEFDGRALGIDIEVVSSTKYVSGGATSLGGVVIDYGHFPQFTERITHEALFNLGAYMTPQVAHLQTLGLETLEVRYRRQAATALALAQWFETRPEVLRVTYAGLPSHPAHALFARQYGGTFGAMLTLDFADRDAAFRFLDALRTAPPIFSTIARWPSTRRAPSSDFSTPKHVLQWMCATPPCVSASGWKISTTCVRISHKHWPQRHAPPTDSSADAVFSTHTLSDIYHHATIFFRHAH